MNSHAWPAALTVTAAATLELTMLSITGASTPHIIGGLRADPANSFWIKSSYMAPLALIIPLSPLLVSRFGRRRVFFNALIVFAITSILSGLATGLAAFIVWRILQGLAGGVFVPLAQSVILCEFPHDRQRLPLTLVSVGTFSGIYFSSVLSGLTADELGWRWIFLGGGPVALVILFAALFTFPPDEQPVTHKPIDVTGIVFLVLAVAGIEVFFGKGQEWNWFHDPFHRAHLAAVVMILGIVLTIRHSLRSANAVLDLAPFTDRHFVACTILVGVGYGLYYAGNGALAKLLWRLYGYDATDVGAVEAPSGFVAIPLLLACTLWLARGRDSRLLVGSGSLILAAGCYWMSGMNLSLEPQQLAWARMIEVAGVILVLVPLMAVAYQSVPLAHKAAAAGLFSFIRFLGGSLGTDVNNVIFDRRLQFHTERLSEGWNLLNPEFLNAHTTLMHALRPLIGDPVKCDKIAWAELQNLRDAQAMSLAAFDIYWLAALTALAMLPLVLLMRGPIKAANR